MEAKEGRFVNGIPVARSIRNDDGVYPIFVEQDGTLYFLQHLRTQGKNAFDYYYVDIGSAVKEFMFHTANVEPESREPGTFVYNEPKTTQDTVNLKLRDINDNLYELEVPVKEKPCAECHNESEPLTSDNVKVGDELEDIVDSRIFFPTVIIVTYNGHGRIYGFSRHTGTYVTLNEGDLPNWRKTGKTYPEIAKIIGGRE